MVTSRSQTNIHRSLGKVRKARAVVIMLLVTVAVTIVFIDKKEDRPRTETLTRVSDTSIDRAVPISQEISYPTTMPTVSRENLPELPKPLVVQSAPEEKPIVEKEVVVHNRIVSPIRDLSSVLKKEEENIKRASSPEAVVAKNKSTKDEAVSDNSVAKKKTLKKMDAVAVSGDARVHVVVPGETLSSIAQKYYGDTGMWLAIQRANQELLHSPRGLKPGHKLNIPDQKTVQEWFSSSQKRVYAKSRNTRANFAETSSGDAVLVAKSPESGKFYCVHKGETLSSIAKRAGISLLSLYDHNKDLKDNPHLLKEGTKIWIPKK